MFNEVIDKMKVSSDESKEYKVKYHEMKELCDEVKRQRINHLGRIKELEQRQQDTEKRQHDTER